MSEYWKLKCLNIEIEMFEYWKLKTKMSKYWKPAKTQECLGSPSNSNM